MRTTAKKYFLSGVPVWLQALLLAIFCVLVLFIVAATLGQIAFFAENIGEPGAYVLHALLLASGCFFICRKYPDSLWYVPLVANVFVILSACIEPVFWTSNLYIWFGCALPSSVAAALWGAAKGKAINNEKTDKHVA